ENADDYFNAGDPSVIESTPEYVVHPPLGKWLIGIGIDIFGADDSFGWRFSVAIIGSLTIFLIGVIAWKLFRSAFFACVAAGLLSVDGEHFVHSRTSLLDIVLMAFVLLAFYFVLLDREQVTKRLASWSKRTSTTSEPTPAEATSSPQTSSPAEATVQSAPTPEATASPAASAADASAPARVRERRRRRDEMNFGPRLGVRPWIIAAGISVGLAMGVKWS